MYPVIACYKVTIGLLIFLIENLTSVLLHQILIDRDHVVLVYIASFYLLLYVLNVAPGFSRFRCSLLIDFPDFMFAH